MEGYRDRTLRKIQEDTAQLEFVENLYKVKFTVMLGDQVIRTFEPEGGDSLDDLAGADVRTDIASLKRE